MSKREKIVCAAVKFTDNGERSHISSIAICVYYSDEKLNDIRSDNIAYGIIATETKGFITNKNRFVDPVEAMKIAIKSGQYPDYELMKRKALEEIGFAKENEKNNESVGILGFKLFVADIPKLVSRVKELDKLLERNYLLPEDLY